MAETDTKDPTQAAAYACITATELCRDAKEQETSCAAAVDTLTALADTVATISALALAGAGVDAAAVRTALEQTSGGLRSLGAVMKGAKVRFAEHATAWEREATVWRSLVEGAKTP